MAGTAAANGFSRTDCGPADRVLLRAGLKSGEMPFLLVCTFLPALFVWLALALLAWLVPPSGGEPAVRFDQDPPTHVRSNRRSPNSASGCSRYSWS